MATTYSITRNGITLALKEFKIIRGDNKDKTYLAIDFTGVSDENTFTFMGFDTVRGFCQTAIKKIAQVTHLDNIDDNSGELNIDKFLAELTEFTSSALNLSELKDKLDEVYNQQNKLIAALDTDMTPEVLAELKENTKLVNVLKAQIEARGRKTKQNEAQPAVAV